jgi:hypothetical protein
MTFVSAVESPLTDRPSASNSPSSSKTVEMSGFSPRPQCGVPCRTEAESDDAMDEADEPEKAVYLE